MVQIIPPVFERELRVAARRRGTFWTRVAVAGVATLVSGWILVGMQLSPYTRPAEISQTVFSVVSGLACFYCLLTGMRNTADCISSEKREGTLGLLFLTDLKGYNVILGKMLATSLNSLYGLVAIFPVLAIPLLLGGVPAEVFWMMTALLVNVLFLSLATGMIMSVFGRQEMRTVGWTFLAILFFTGGIPFLGLVGADLWHRFVVGETTRDAFSRPPPDWTLWPSPVYAFVQLMERTFSGGAGKHFWNSMLTMHGLGWFFLLLASLRVPYCWQDRAASAQRMKVRETLSRWTHGNSAIRAHYRRGLLDVNAFFWLAARNRVKPWAVWMVLSATGLFWLWGWFKWPSDFTDEIVFILIGLWLHTVLKLWIASESCQRVAEDHQSGALELLLSTPLTVREILRGQWLALRRQFLWPAVTVLAYDLVVGVRYSGAGRQHWTALLAAAGGAVLIADLLTLPWVGVWLGLLKRNTSKAFSAAMFRVMVLPWVLFGVLMQILSILSFTLWRFDLSSEGILAIWVGLSISLDVLFLFSARHRLLTRFREVATQRAPARRRWWFLGKSQNAPSAAA